MSGLWALLSTASSLGRWVGTFSVSHHLSLFGSPKVTVTAEEMFLSETAVLVNSTQWHLSGNIVYHRHLFITDSVWGTTLKAKFLQAARKSRWQLSSSKEKSSLVGSKCQKDSRWQQTWDTKFSQNTTLKSDTLFDGTCSTGCLFHTGQTEIQQIKQPIILRKS